MNDNEQDGYVDNNIFVDGKQQAVFLQNFRRELDENEEIFDLRSIGNYLPGRKTFFGSLATSFDSLIIKVIKDFACSKELSEQLTSKYKQIGYCFCEEVDVSTGKPDTISEENTGDEDFASQHSSPDHDNDRCLKTIQIKFISLSL
jgi:hypothetical protein